MMSDPHATHRGILVVLSAPSGAGKTSLCRAAVNEIPNLTHSISYTTRPPRPSEEHGRDYYFVDQDTFHDMVGAGEFLEWARVHGNLYGTSRRVIEEIQARGSDVILDVDAEGAQKLMAQPALDATFVFVVTPTFAELATRLTGRGSDAAEEIERRLTQAKKEIAQFAKYHYLLVNDDFQRALQDLMAIFHAERCSVKRVDRHWIQTEFLGS
jgi:guanylate kinase